MGKHFDSLVEIVKQGVPTLPTARSLDSMGYSADVSTYLPELIEKSSLFEMDIISTDLAKQHGGDIDEYFTHLRNYLNLSQRHGKHLITPFPTTAIEDQESVVIMDHRMDDWYRLTDVRSVGDGPSKQIDNLTVLVANVRLMGLNEDNIFPMIVEPLHSSYCIDGKAILSDFTSAQYKKRFQEDVMNSASEWLKEVVYIMDPGNFIMERESNASIQQETKRNRKNTQSKKPLKTIMRPHYIVRSERDMQTFFASESDEPNVIHPVRAHWRTLRSERFTHKQGQIIPVRQHYSGKGSIQGRNGWNYKVLLKDDELNVLPYKSPLFENS